MAAVACRRWGRLAQAAARSDVLSPPPPPAPPCPPVHQCNCNAAFKPLGKALGIKVAPTFHLYRRAKLLAVFTGAKMPELELLIAEHR